MLIDQVGLRLERVMCVDEDAGKREYASQFIYGSKQNPSTPSHMMMQEGSQSQIVRDGGALAWILRSFSVGFQTFKRGVRQVGSNDSGVYNGWFPLSDLTRCKRLRWSDKGT